MFFFFSYLHLLILVEKLISENVLFFSYLHLLTVFVFINYLLVYIVIQSGMF